LKYCAIRYIHSELLRQSTLTLMPLNTRNDLCSVLLPYCTSYISMMILTIQHKSLKRKLQFTTGLVLPAIKNQTVRVFTT